MANLLPSEQLLMDDVVGLLDFDEAFSPRGSLGQHAASEAALQSDQEANDASASSGTSDDNSKTNKLCTKKEKEKFRQRRYRQRLKTSRKALQHQLEELFGQLEALTQEAAQRKKKKIAAAKSQASTSHWAKEADAQCTLRLQSEAQQQQLISAMSFQAEYIKNLSHMCSARLDRNACEDGSCSFELRTPTLYTMTSMLYTTYLQQLEGCYARVDTIMDACGMASLPQTTLNTTHRRKTDACVAYFQQVNKVILPYSFQQTCKVLWKVVQEQDEPAFRGIDVAPDNDVYIKSRVLQATDIGSMAQRYVSRQYLEEKRMVLVWKVTSQGEDDFRGLCAEETGWMCVEPSPEGVMLSVCVQQVPMHFSASKSTAPAVSQFYRLLNDSIEADKVEMTKCMGRMLLDDVLTGIDY